MKIVSQKASQKEEADLIKRKNGSEGAERRNEAETKACPCGDGLKGVSLSSAKVSGVATTAL
jgi:hypothetical protein